MLTPLRIPASATATVRDRLRVPILIPVPVSVLVSAPAPAPAPTQTQTQTQTQLQPFAGPSLSPISSLNPIPIVRIPSYQSAPEGKQLPSAAFKVGPFERLRRLRIPHRPVNVWACRAAVVSPPVACRLVRGTDRSLAYFPATSRGRPSRSSEWSDSEAAGESCFCPPAHGWKIVGFYRTQGS